MTAPRRTTGRSAMAHLRRSWRTAVPIILAAALATLTVIPAMACDENTVLDFVGSLEAPGGYDTVYYGVRIEPPRAITAMSVGEVLDWQRRTVRGGSVSSAAGRYQIIRPTLSRLVDTGVVSRADTFDTATQDRLGRHLLRETGYRPGDASPATANRIAGVWAALPRIGGPGAGRSVYEGVAGNHALVRAATWQGVLECRIAVADTAAEAAAVRAGERFGFAWDRFIGELAAASERAAAGLAQGTISLLFVLFAADLVWRGGRWAIAGEATGFFAALIARLLAVIMCLALIAAAGRMIGFVSDLAARLAGSAGGGTRFSMAEFAASKLALAFSLFEGAGSLPVEIQAMIAVLAVTALLTWDLRSVTDPATAALILVFMEAIALALVFLLPRTAGALVEKA